VVVIIVLWGDCCEGLTSQFGQARLQFARREVERCVSPLPWQRFVSRHGPVLGVALRVQVTAAGAASASRSG
jgi:hypothetical protein